MVLCNQSTPPPPPLPLQLPLRTHTHTVLWSSAAEHIIIHTLSHSQTHTRGETSSGCFQILIKKKMRKRLHFCQIGPRSRQSHKGGEEKESPNICTYNKWQHLSLIVHAKTFYMRNVLCNEAIFCYYCVFFHSYIFPPALPLKSDVKIIVFDNASVSEEDVTVISLLWDRKKGINFSPFRYIKWLLVCRKPLEILWQFEGDSCYCLLKASVQH